MSKNRSLDHEPDGTFVDQFICNAGVDITENESKELEQLVEADESNLKARLQLLGYYFKYMENERIAPKRQKHILWMIRNRPRDIVSGSPRLTWVKEMPKYQRDAIVEWERQIEQNPDDPSVLGNAAFHFRSCRADKAKALYEYCLTLEPDNPRWIKALTNTEAEILENEK